MYNATYHPLEGDNLKNILDNASEEEKKVIMEQVNAATAIKTRNYRITIVPPDERGRGGTWYNVENGIVTGSCREE
ncbi:MAG: hypothetical protein JXA44_07715 [Methanospirillaceae archaeon]|nr:hypothetical protein [Methanospirillaceae archaeon]